MWEAISTMFMGLDPNFRVILILLLIPTGIWIFSHIRVDKNGKRYWYSDKYQKLKEDRKRDDMINGVSKIQDLVYSNNRDIIDVKSHIKDNTMEIKRLRILNLIQHSPNEKAIISQEYDAYKAMGGNSYMDEVYKQYMEGLK